MEEVGKSLIHHKSERAAEKRPSSLQGLGKTLSMNSRVVEVMHRVPLKPLVNIHAIAAVVVITAVDRLHEHCSPVDPDLSIVSLPSLPIPLPLPRRFHPKQIAAGAFSRPHNNRKRPPRPVACEFPGIAKKTSSGQGSIDRKPRENGGGDGHNGVGNGPAGQRKSTPEEVEGRAQACLSRC